MDREDIADNMVRIWKSEPRNALEVAANLITKICDVYSQALVDDDEQNILDVETAIKSP